MKPFFNKPRFVTIVAYILVFCMALISIEGAWLLFNSVQGETPPIGGALRVLLLMFVVWTIVPLLIFLASYGYLGSRRRAERAIMGVILAYIYIGFSSALFSIPTPIGSAASLVGDGVYIWLQFWPNLIALVITAVLLRGVTTNLKSRKWQLSLYIAWLGAMVASVVSSLANVLPTLYYNEGARYNPATYMELFVPLVIVGVVGFLLIRRNTIAVVKVSIIGQVILLVFLVTSVISRALSGFY